MSFMLELAVWTALNNAIENQYTFDCLTDEEFNPATLIPYIRSWRLR